MSSGFDEGIRRILGTMQDMVQAHVDDRLRNIVAGGKIVASAIPLSSLRHAMQSLAHTDADHTTIPNDKDVWTFNATTQTWGPAAPTGGGGGTSTDQLIDSTTGQMLRESSNDLLIREAP